MRCRWLSTLFMTFPHRRRASFGAVSNAVYERRLRVCILRSSLADIETRFSPNFSPCSSGSLRWKRQRSNNLRKKGGEWGEGEKVRSCQKSEEGRFRKVSLTSESPPAPDTSRGLLGPNFHPSWCQNLLFLDLILSLFGL